MNKRLKVMVGVMILVIIAGGVYLWSNSRSKDMLANLDLKGYDITTTCARADEHTLVCNKGYDVYLYLDDMEVYLQKSKTVVDENGDERTFNEYKQSSMNQLMKKTKEDEDVPILIWMNGRGKVETVMMLETTYENNNASIAALEGLDPSKYTSANTVLDIDRKGMQLAPVHYDGKEKEKYQGTVKTFKFAKAVRYYHVEITNFEDKEDKVFRNTSYSKSDYAKTKTRLANGREHAYVWINQNGRIYAVLTYTEKTQ